MKVKIIKAGKDTHWYANRIGEIFEVGDKTDMDGDYRVNNLVDNCIDYIDKQDCKIIGDNMKKEQPFGKETRRKIEELENKMKESCAEFQAQIDELKWVNPMRHMDINGHYVFVDTYGHIGEEFDLNITRDIKRHEAGNYFHPPAQKLAEQVRDKQLLERLMLRDSLDSWKGEEVDWYLATQNKYGVTEINHSVAGIHCLARIWTDDFITPTFKTEKALLISITKHRDLFDKVFGCKGYEIV